MSTDPNVSGEDDRELNVTCSINADIYPDLYAALVRKSKGPRSELLRALANEALTARRFAASSAQRMTNQAGPEEAPASGHERPRGA